MKNKKPLSLYGMWLEAHKRNDVPSEWKLAHNFLIWATANGYKTEYGYKGEFTTDNLKLAMSGMEDNPEQPLDAVSELVNNNTLATLKEMAKGIDLGKATKKEDIARLIVAAGDIKVDDGEADEEKTGDTEDPEVTEDAGE